MANNSYRFDEEVGLLKKGTIVSYSPTTGKIEVKLNVSSAAAGSSVRPITVYAPYSLFSNNGLFMGSKPSIGTPVIVSQGSGNQYYFVSFLAENVKQVPTLNENELLIQSNNKTKITLNTDNNIYIGSVANRIHIDTEFNLLTSNFNNEQHFTQAYRELNGIVRRERKNTNLDANSKLENDDYDSKYKIIGLDPTVSPNLAIAGTSKNPPFVEHREMIYEFQYSSNVSDDLSESQIYAKSKPTKQIYSFPNRHKSKADTLSLTLASPNYLMESVKGTVVDIFGNILDINRVPIQIGKDQNTLNDELSTDKVSSFLNIKALERKSIAYHFEINARKDFSKKLDTTSSIVDLFDFDSNADYSRNRSRFYLDIDKEGQLKLNVPASSEKGNIPLLVRYENFSTVSPEDNNNPDKIIYRDDNLDILQDSFAAGPMFKSADYDGTRGVIAIKDGDSVGTPIDRITKTHIKHGTAYHDILNTCYAHQQSDFLQYQYFLIDTVDSAGNTVEGTAIDVDSIPLLKNVVSDTINISGDNANAGGRSASINFDGMVEMNIGANSLDRQSLWLDTAGGIVANIGRDKQNMSAALGMNGDVFIQIGGMGIVGDSRFEKQQNGQIGAVLDLRVFTDGFTCHLIRIDKNGLSIMTPGSFNVYANNGITLAGKSLSIDVDNCTIQGRAVIKELNGSI